MSEDQRQVIYDLTSHQYIPWRGEQSYMVLPPSGAQIRLQEFPHHTIQLAGLWIVAQLLINPPSEIVALSGRTTMQEFPHTGNNFLFEDATTSINLQSIVTEAIEKRGYTVTPKVATIFKV